MNSDLPFAALAFDLDGTLVDSVPGIAAALDAVLRADGRPALGPAATRRLVGEGAPRLLAQAAAATGRPWADPAAALDAWLHAYAHTEPAGTTPYPGSDDLLRHLHAAGLPLALVTNKPATPTHAILARLGWSSLFVAVIAGDTLPTRKPDPAPLRAAVAALGAPAPLVGDSPIDAATAQAAGLPFIGFRGGYSSVPLETLRPTAIFDGPAHFHAWVRQRQPSR
jgi:phosphoglycolate phosphatase